MQQRIHRHDRRPVGAGEKAAGQSGGHVKAHGMQRIGDFWTQIRR